MSLKKYLEMMSAIWFLATLSAYGATTPFSVETLQVAGFTIVVPDRGARMFGESIVNRQGLTMPGGVRRSLDMRRTSDRALLSATYRKYDARRVSDGFVKQPVGVSHSTMTKGSPSGIPIGNEVAWDKNFGRLLIYCVTRFEDLVVSLSMQDTDSQGFFKVPERDWTADQELIESFARLTIARGAGMRLGEMVTSSLAGASIPTATCERSNAKFGDLRAWSTAKGWSVTENKALGVLTVKRGQTFVVIPLGTAWVKWDGATWTKMSDVVMEKDGRVMAPKDVLDRLNAM